MNVKCPSCGKITEYAGNPFRPFCSGECKDKDLISWADERYSIPGQEMKKKEKEDENNREGSSN